MAGPLRGGKGGTFEGGMREPTIAWWPGHIAPGATSDAVAGEIDVLPTFVKLAGGVVPADAEVVPLRDVVGEHHPRAGADPGQHGEQHAALQRLRLVHDDKGVVQ